MNLAKKYKTLLAKNGITTPLRLSHFFAQLHHESGLKPIEENLRYSAKRLREVFPKYFHTIEMANRYAMKEREIANRVYANRMGNGNENSGDGWKYRGRGFIQLTGKENYTKLSNATGICYVQNPDLLLNEADAMIAALWFWNSRNLNIYADRDDVRAVTLRINGGYNGLKHREDLTDYYKKIFL